MHISCIEGDPYYSRYSAMIEIYADGELVKYCVAADDKSGIYTVLARKDNEFVLTDDKQSLAMMDCYSDNLVIKFKE